MQQKAYFLIQEIKSFENVDEGRIYELLSLDISAIFNQASLAESKSVRPFPVKEALGSSYDLRGIWGEIFNS